MFLPLGLASVAVAATLLPGVLVAQSPEATNEGVRVGDRWVYDSKDEITGFRRTPTPSL